MANGHGGARVGSGKKKKALSDKILEGDRKVTILKLPEPAVMEGVTMPKPREYLLAQQRDGKELLAKDVYEKIWQWLIARGCAALINPELLEQYSIAVARVIQCEEVISTYGFLSKHPTSGNPMQSPYVAMAQSYLKQANTIWFMIYQVVKENCSSDYQGGQSPHTDVMERLLTQRRDKR
jgi:hypothetical protein